MLLEEVEDNKWMEYEKLYCCALDKYSISYYIYTYQLNSKNNFKVRHPFSMLLSALIVYLNFTPNKDTQLVNTATVFVIKMSEMTGYCSLYTDCLFSVETTNASLCNVNVQLYVFLTH